MKRANVINLLFNMMPTNQPAATPQPDQWAFLDHVDAPQWVDLAQEAALMGTVGDDPWFYRSHSHHETSLARIGSTALAIESPSLREKARPQPVTRKRSIILTKGKPSVKGYLGGIKRISIAGLKEDRLSNRPRIRTSQTWPRTPVKRISMKGASPRARVGAPGSDARLAANSPSDTPRKMLLNGKFADPAVSGLRRPTKGTRSSVETVENRSSSQGSDSLLSGTGRLTGGSDRNVSDLCLSDHSLNLNDSPKPLLESTPVLERNVSTVSSSDMTCSSAEASPTPSKTSREEGTKRSGLPGWRSQTKVRRNLNAQNFSKQAPVQQQDTKSLARAKNSIGCKSSSSKNILASSKPSDLALFSRDVRLKVKSDPDLSQLSTPASTPSSTPRHKRKSLGSPLRTKQDGFGHLSSKKSVISNSVLSQDVVISDKLCGSQATHPVLEKLRKSWGTALRVKQRKAAETSEAIGNSDSKENVVHKTVVGVSVMDAAEPGESRNEPSVSFEERATSVSNSTEASGCSDTVLQSSNGVGQELRKDDAEGPRSDALHGSQEQSLINQISPRSESGTMTQGSRLQPVARASLSKSKSLGGMDTRERMSSTTAKRALVQQPKLKTEAPAKIKKVSLNRELPTKMSLPRKGNKENLSSGPSHKSLSNSQDNDRRKKLSSSLLKSTTVTSTRPPTGSSPASLTRTTTSGRTSATLISRAGAASRSRSLPSVRETEPTAKSSESATRRTTSLAALRESSSSVPGMSKQKSEKFASQGSVKEKDSRSGATTTVVRKASAASSLVADGYVTEGERRHRLTAKYEPRLHSAKTIREWESKTGKRYYDLQPGDRQRANQEISAMKEKSVPKRGSA